MNLGIDALIFTVFLIVTLVIGIFSSRGVKTIKQYAIGDRNFSTLTISATLIATWISGSAFLTDISEVYKGGLFYMVPGMLGDIFSCLIICYFLAPRMGEFLGTLSIADAMGNLYGQKVRFITSISSVFNCIGKLAAQFKVAATILQLFFGLSSFYATVASSLVLIIYSTFGGIKAVTFTDVIQFFTFGTVIPIIALIIWGNFNDPSVVFSTISQHELFDYTQLIDTSNYKFWGSIGLAFYFIIPSFNPAIFQRVSMAKDTTQVASSFFIATMVRLAISILFFWIGILLITNNPNLEPTQLLSYIIDNYTYIVGFKGLIAIGIIAMAMSTADSYLNAATVTLSYDIKKSFGYDITEKYNLYFSYICSTIIGVLAFILAFYMKGLLSIFLLVSNFYLPVVTVPFLLAILGFRSTAKAVLIGIIAGLCAVVTWRILWMESTGVDSVIPGMLANLVFLIGSHYLFKEPGGWVGIKDGGTFEIVKKERRKRWEYYINKIKTFDLLTFCQNNTPSNESAYSIFGIFCIIAVFSTMYSLPIEIRQQYSKIIEFIYHSVLLSSSAFLTYPIWPPTFRSDKFIAVFWIIGLFYILAFVGGLQVIISNFGQFQLMIFLLSMVVLAMLVRWHVALFLIVSGIVSSVYFFKWYTGIENFDTNFGTLQFKVTYLLLLVGGVLIAFFKPQQEHLKATEEKAAHWEGKAEELDVANKESWRLCDSIIEKMTIIEREFQNKEAKEGILKEKELYLQERIRLMKIEMLKNKDMKNEFIRNLPHETNTPLTVVLSLCDVLYSYYDNLDANKIKGVIKDIINSGDRLKTYVHGITDLSKLSSLTYELNKKPINLSKLIRERTILYKKIFSDETPTEFNLNISEAIVVSCDKYYMAQAIDNLISNAAIYGKGKPITINLSKISDNNIRFEITDQGIGIPQDELVTIFNTFTVSSKTKTPAGGRGIGLTLIEKIIKLHDGKIWAESDNYSGSSFYFTLPIK
ncbi:Solute carrier and signal transduction histidine kinase domain protein [Candidatus Megaera venefica]|uniref:histidine kinase n=1 Tax=Candidatus Megaera venefica TaxID=2055910 RepID=A0ABU5NCY2_9RICK|nr:ATP-binding protein [Candidatus Megaera venefica]MEA0971034.1 Solute carrier and signal transduction histidine kinase domain protein [Candidatus Megaera venefica]